MDHCFIAEYSSICHTVVSFTDNYIAVRQSISVGVSAPYFVLNKFVSSPPYSKTLCCWLLSRCLLSLSSINAVQHSVSANFVNLKLTIVSNHTNIYGIVFARNCKDNIGIDVSKNSMSNFKVSSTNRVSSVSTVSSVLK